jgi:lysyl-tRNA synthetase class II
MLLYEIGMKPLDGGGLGIRRLTMQRWNPSLRIVLLFPDPIKHQ